MTERGATSWKRTLAVGLAVLAAGVALALLLLPEWRAGDPSLSKDQFRQRYREVVERAGFRLAPGEPRVRLRLSEMELRDVYRLLREDAAAWLTEQRGALVVEVCQRVTGPLGTSTLTLDFSLDGRPRAAIRWDESLAALSTQGSPAVNDQMTRLLLAPGESLRPWRDRTPESQWLPIHLSEIEGSSPQEHLGILPNRVWRRAGPPTDRGLATAEALMELGPGLLMWGLLMATAALWLALALANRLGLANAFGLALLSVAVSALFLLASPTRGFYLWVNGGALAYMALLCALLWSVGESLVRSHRIDFSTSLDALRSARLGPRGGRALLHGLGYGAGIAGLWLGLLAIAVALPGIYPLGARIPLPLFSPPESYFPAQYLLDAAGALLAIGLASYLPARWSPWVAAFLAPWFSPASPLFYFEPWPIGLIVGFAPSAVLVHAFYRSGMTAMLTASVATVLFPSALLAALHAAWSPGTLVTSTALLAAVGVLGAWGLSRPAEVDAEGGRPPAFVRRLRAKRDLRYEMDLLARMQHGLLPRQVPTAGGYEIAAHSAVQSGSAAGAEGNLYDVLQDDAGRLWVVTADVAGQGYSRAVAQAMIKAVLVSSMDGSREGSDRLPSEILGETRRVLYREGPACESAALTIGRIDPRTGRAVVACAGAPPPLLLADGEVSSAAPSGPPLTPGSAAGYQDAEILLPPGGALLFCSAGLFGAADWSGVPFGQGHLREELRSVSIEPAAAILQTLLDGWRRHTTLEEPPAGTTIVALRRLTREELAGDAAA